MVTTNYIDYMRKQWNGAFEWSPHTNNWGVTGDGAITNATPGTSWAAKLGGLNNSTGQVTDIAFASFIGRTLTFSIATVSLRRIAAGNTQVTLTPSPQNPFGSGGQPLAVSLVGASVGPTVTNTGVGVPVGPFAGVAIAASLLATGVRALRARGRAR